MSPNTARRLYVPESADVARTLLGELRNAHRHLIGQLRAMDALTSERVVDPTMCATSRWRLGQASLGRRLLAARICDYFLPRLEPERRTGLRALAEADRALLLVSSAHLSRWPAMSIQSDWPGFCSASREMQGRTYEQIAFEQRLLYPMLEEAARRA